MYSRVVGNHRIDIRKSWVRFRPLAPLFSGRASALTVGPLPQPPAYLEDHETDV